MAEEHPGVSQPTRPGPSSCRRLQVHSKLVLPGSEGCWGTVCGSAAPAPSPAPVEPFPHGPEFRGPRLHQRLSRPSLAQTPGLLEFYLSPGGLPAHKNATETRQNNSLGWGEEGRRTRASPCPPAPATGWDISEATQISGLSPAFLAMLLL